MKKRIASLIIIFVLAIGTLSVSAREAINENDFENFTSVITSGVLGEDMVFDVMPDGYNYFPTKEYRGIKYKEGYYESIVISIGAAEGDNWWCVLFPNICIADLENNSDIEYKSFVIETINKILK